VYKWFLLLFQTSYAIGIAGYILVLFTIFGINLMFRIRPETVKFVRFERYNAVS